MRCFISKIPFIRWNIGLIILGQLRFTHLSVYCGFMVHVYMDLSYMWGWYILTTGRHILVNGKMFINVFVPLSESITRICRCILWLHNCIISLWRLNCRCCQCHEYLQLSHYDIMTVVRVGAHDSVRSHCQRHKLVFLAFLIRQDRFEANIRISTYILILGYKNALISYV